MHESVDNKSQQITHCASVCAALPLAILALAVFLSFMFQLQQTASDRTTLQQVREGQNQALVQSKEVQERLDRLAVATVRLADSGNANAKTLVERMKQAGITINPSKIQNPAAPVAPVVAAPPSEPTPEPAAK